MQIASAMRQIVFVLLLCTSSAFAVLSDKELDEIGRRVWINECAGTKEGLTSWNGGENFASLGIGHFIWYPPRVEGPFEESFPKLVSFLETKSLRVPGWMHGDCPWPSRVAFNAAVRTPDARMKELRDLLYSTIHFQSAFLALRMDQSLQKMLAAAGPNSVRVRNNYWRLAASKEGTFALIDYVNFKGEGTNKNERNAGGGWGLLQVLTAMDEKGSAPAAFARAAAIVLQHRVQFSDPARHEQQWLAGWLNRVRAYGR
jgi:hypothetical protein